MEVAMQIDLLATMERSVIGNEICQILWRK